MNKRKGTEDTVVPVASERSGDVRYWPLADISLTLTNVRS
jgi:hypothetical protein